MTHSNKYEWFANTNSITNQSGLVVLGDIADLEDIVNKGLELMMKARCPYLKGKPVDLE